MLGTRKTCPQCRHRFTRPSGSSRLYCETCRPPKQRGKAVVAAPVVDLDAERQPGMVETATLADLVSVGRELSSSGAVALMLARQMDAGGHTGSQVAALARELRSCIASASEGAMPVGDVLDELQQRRAERIGRTA